MNRLILIGNGFDLAHGLKTSYKDFIEYLWKGIFNEIEQEENYPTNFEDSNKFIRIKVYSNYAGEHSIKSSINRYLKLDHSIELEDIILNLTTKNVKIVIDIIEKLEVSYSNTFFKIISQNYIDKNWSDIEADYYKELLIVRYKQEEIDKLNQQFNQIKELLRNYLKSLSQPNKIDKLENIIYEPIKFNDLKLGYNPSPTRNIGIFINIDIFKDLMSYFKNRFLRSIMFLNFNYTQTENLYLKNNIQVNHIHGSLDDPNNHMIFGYGDEESEEYKKLENPDYKGLLDNVKSINYLEASNYRNMERFIESAPYQIFVMGMSCGMADRTMLRKLRFNKTVLLSMER